MIAELCRKACAYGNHPSISKNLEKFEKTLRKEERNKCAEAFPCWLELFFSRIFLTPQDLICKEGKSDRLFFDFSFLETPFSICVNKFASTKDEIELYCSSAMTRHLVRTHDIRFFCPDKDNLLLDYCDSGALLHVRIHPQASTANAYSVGQNLCTTIG